MLVFDYPIVHDSVSFDDFWVQMDDGEYADIIEMQVCDNLVFLKLANELVPSATPAVGMNENEYIRLDAGTEIVRLFFAGVEINDGISPTLTMSLSGGSGTGTGDEGPDRLTKDKIDITVTSDEPLHEPPRVTVVCDDIQWTETTGSELIHHNIGDFIANRNGQIAETRSAAFDARSDQLPDYWCGDDDDFTLTTSSMTATGEKSWTYEWRNHTETPYKLNDGILTTVAHARDRSGYERHNDGAKTHNWSAASVGFTLDTELKSPLKSFRGYNVHPPNGSKTLATRPHVSVLFTEPTAVTLQSFRVDGVNRLDEIQPDRWSSNRFLFWPPKLKLGTHLVEVSASDAAGNTVTFETRFESDLRPPFILRLQPGWNAISFPGPPEDGSMDSIFTNPSIRFVVKWRPFIMDEPWLWSTRRQGEWQTHGRDDLKFYSRYGLWVYSEDAVSQPVRLSPNFCSEADFPRGWVFAGVLNTNQIEDHFGEDLSYGGDTVTAHRYLRDHEIAYRWDAENQRYIVLKPDDPITIGEAIWVYYGERATTRSLAICP